MFQKQDQVLAADVTCGKVGFIMNVPRQPGGAAEQPWERLMLEKFDIPSHVRLLFCTFQPLLAICCTCDLLYMRFVVLAICCTMWALPMYLCLLLTICTLQHAEEDEGDDAVPQQEDQDQRQR